MGGNSSGALICYFLHSVWNIWIDSQETSQTAASPPLHPPTPNSSAFPCQHVLNWSMCACVYSYAYGMCVYACVPGQRLKSSNLEHRIVLCFGPIVQAAECSERQIQRKNESHGFKCLHLFMHLADHFIQSDLRCIQSRFYQSSVPRIPSYDLVVARSNWGTCRKHKRALANAVSRWLQEDFGYIQVSQCFMEIKL